MVADANLDVHVATLVPDGNGPRTNAEDAQGLGVLCHLDPQTPNLGQGQSEFLKSRDHELQRARWLCFHRGNEILSRTTLAIDFHDVVADVHAIVGPRLIPTLY